MLLKPHSCRHSGKFHHPSRPDLSFLFHCLLQPRRRTGWLMEQLRPRVRCLRRKTVINVTPTSTRSREVCDRERLSSPNFNAHNLICEKLEESQTAGGAFKIRLAANLKACRAKTLLLWQAWSRRPSSRCCCAQCSRDLSFFCVHESCGAPPEHLAGWQRDEW